MKFSVFGANGFIGSNMVHFLKSQNHECSELEPNDEKIFDRPLGNVIYCIGLTADFRERPFDTVEAHVCLLHKILKGCKFDSFLYLSSTRVYSNSTSTNERDRLHVEPTNPDSLYNISKLMGESLCLASKSQNIRIARLSNVVGIGGNHNDFLNSLIHDASSNKKVLLHTTPTSEKDYVYIDDVIKILEKIAINGKENLYNVASGTNTKVIEIINEIINITNCKIDFSPDAVENSFSKINIEKIQKEFNFKPTPFCSKLKDIILEIKNEKII